MHDLDGLAIHNFYRTGVWDLRYRLSITATDRHGRAAKVVVNSVCAHGFCSSNNVASSHVDPTKIGLSTLITSKTKILSVHSKLSVMCVSLEVSAAVTE